MNIVTAVKRMQQAGVTIKMQENKLQVLADRPLNDQQSEFVKEHKAEFLHYLEVINDPSIQRLQLMFDAELKSVERIQ